MIFGDRESRARYEAEIERCRRAQRVQYAVAPGHALETVRGLLPSGAEVRLEDLPPEEGLSPWRVMQRLIRRGQVLAAEHVPRPHPDAIAVVADGRSIVTPRGILANGDGVTVDDIGPDSLPRLIARGDLLPVGPGSAA